MLRLGNQVVLALFQAASHDNNGLEILRPNLEDDTGRVGFHSTLHCRLPALWAAIPFRSGDFVARRGRHTSMPTGVWIKTNDTGSCSSAKQLEVERWWSTVNPTGLQVLKWICTHNGTLGFGAYCGLDILMRRFSPASCYQNTCGSTGPRSCGW